MKYLCCKEKCWTPTTSRYCYKHRCITCKNVRLSHSNFCYACNCAYIDCESKKMNGFQYCTEHKCIFVDCNELIVCNDIFIDGFYKKLSVYCQFHDDSCSWLCNPT